MSGMWEDMPELTDEHERKANQCYRAYIFYHKVNNNTKEGRCTACDAVITVSKVQRITTADDMLFYNAKHNDPGKCPNCGTDITYKSSGRSVQWKTLSATGRLVILLPVNENKVYVRAFYVVKNYENHDKGYDACMLWSETARYILQPGEWHAYKRQWDYTGLGIGLTNRSVQSGLNEAHTAIEPFAPSAGMGFINEYCIINEEVINETFLKYAQTKVFSEGKNVYSCQNKMIRYLTLYCKYPQFEMLMKFGHRDAVDEFVYNNRKNTSILKWEAKDPASFFKMPKQEYKEFRKNGGNLTLLKAYKKLYKNSPNSTTYEIVQNYMSSLTFHYNEWQEIVIKYHIPHAHYFNYLQKSIEKSKEVRDAYIMHRDYLKSAETLEYDLTNEVVLLPKKLKKAHDIAYKTVQAKQEEIREMKRKKEEEEADSMFANLFKKRNRQYVYSDENFCIIQPERVQDIINEGKAQEHCVGGYALRHAQGKLTILFLRNVNTPEVSYQTLEMDGTTMRQIQGYKNKTPLSKKADEFLQKWHSWVEAGSPRDKQGNPITTEEERDRVLVAS